MSFTRRYSAMPSAAELTKVSGIVLVDAAPAQPASAAPFGKICVVGEFEDGPFATPTDLLQESDQASIFGLFGFTYGTQQHQYPCAKRSGGSEDWNGNGWVQTSKLLFGATAFCRVDTSAGQLALTPRAFVQGAKLAPFALTPSQTFIVTPNGGSPSAATFSATAASVTAVSGAYTSFTGGEQFSFSIDGALVVVTFQPGDNTLDLIIARINQVYGATVASKVSSQLKLTSPTKGTASAVAVTNNTVANGLGFSSGNSNLSGAGGGNVADISAVTQAELKSIVEGAVSGTVVTTSADGYPRVVSTTGGSGSIQINGGTGNASLGFAQQTSATTAALPVATTIPAGTRASDGGAGSTRVVTMQTTTIAKGSTGTTLIKVRPAVDDGTYAGLSSGSLDTLEDKVGDFEWSVGNPLSLSAALTADQLDSLYLAAIDATVGVGNDTTKRINGIVSARQSNAIRARLKQNAVTTSANGHYGRRSFLCAPNGTSASTIIGSGAQGVGSYRAEENTFCAGGVRCLLQEMIDGGYSTDGVIVRHPDVMLAARWSVLPPGYNPGQFPEETKYRWDNAIFLGLETSAQGWDLSTYAAFKQAGVCAVEFDKDTGVGFEQGITAVDPLVDPSRVDISRKTLADFLGDSFASLAKPQSKRQGTTQRRELVLDQMRGLLLQLPDTVESFKLSVTTSGLPAKVVQYNVSVKPVQSDDVIVFNLKVGANVDLTRG